MQNFRNLRVWQEAHQLTVAVYRATAEFPKAELYGLTSQIRRAASSIEANLAEGCGRRSDAELARFGRIAMGSASELECHFLLARDLGFLTDIQHSALEKKLDSVKRMLHGLLQKLETTEKKGQQARGAATR